MALTVRAYQPSDYAVCRRGWAELAEHHRALYGDQTIGGSDPGAGFDAYLEHPDLAAVWVSVEDGEVVGLAGLLVTRDRGEVEPVIVSESHRSRGVGRALVEQAIEEAHARGLVYVKARPVARNAEALSFFHEAGFRRLGHLEVVLDLQRRARGGATLCLYGRDYES